MAEKSPNSIRVGSMTIWLDAETGILMVDPDEGAELDIEVGPPTTQAYIKLTGGKPAPLLVDMSQITSISKETRDYYGKDPTHIETYTAVALVVSSVLSRVLANFFMGLNKPLRPTKLFDDRAKALEWLVQFSK